MTEKTIQPPCFGKLFDGLDEDCKNCKLFDDCKTKNNDLDGIEPAIVNEAEAEAEAETEINPPEPTPKPEPKPESKPKKEISTRSRTALKTASFRKDADGKFVLMDVDEKTTPDLVVSAGDIITVNNPRSKFNGQKFIVSCYSEKYECFRGKNTETGANADFMPQHVFKIKKA